MCPRAWPRARGRGCVPPVSRAASHPPFAHAALRVCVCAQHGLNKDTLTAKLPLLCNEPPDRRTWDLLKSMAECTPLAVEQMLQKYVAEAGPGHFVHIPQITEVMCKLPFGAHGSAAGKALKLLKQCAAQVQRMPCRK